jgi:hypothetical protein
MRVVIGHDSREEGALDVALASLHRTSGIGADMLRTADMHERGLFWRPMLDGVDIISGVRQSTEFAVSRFLVPVMLRGVVLFTDCDVVFLRDVAYMPFDHTKAVSVVKHPPLVSAAGKMDGQTQRDYHRKNWSSVAMWNCDHPANRRLTLQDVNTRHRDYLHGFAWLHDDEIGELSPEWNWLVGVTPKPENPGIAHFTLGGPWLPNWARREHDDIWWGAQR